MANWTPIAITTVGPLISHTLFVDDVFLFAEATLDNVSTILNVLNDSLLIVNLSSTWINQKYFSQATVMIKFQIFNIHSIKRVSNIGTYLGFPLLSKNPKHSDFNQLISRLNTKLCCWKSKTLTFAIRLTLAKSVSFAIPTHIMQCFHLLSKTSYAINKTIRGFIWGSYPNNRKTHLLNWNMVIQPKKYGDL